MPFSIVTGDILEVRADAVVVPANEQLLIDGGVGLKVALAAGRRKLQRACDAAGGCETGTAVVTPAFSLRARHIVHVVGPVWQGGGAGEEALLAQAYESALISAYQAGDASVALPLISAGTYGYPADKALSVAVRAIRSFLDDRDLDITLVLYDRRAVRAGLRNAAELSRYLDEAHFDMGFEGSASQQTSMLISSVPRQGFAGGYLADMDKMAARDSREVATAAELAPETNGWAEETGCFAPVPSDGNERESSHEDLGEYGDYARLEAREWLYCPHCGNKCVQTAVFCPRCGLNLHGTAPDATAAPSYAMYPEDDRTSPQPMSAAQAPTCGDASGSRPAAVAAAMPKGSHAPSQSSPVAKPAERMGGMHIHFGKPHHGSQARRADLDAWLQQADESLADTLIGLIDERGFTDAQVYKRANISRQVFNKIKNDSNYHPKKPTVLALCVALELDVDETEDVLSRAGFALNPSSKFDLIVQYYISRGCFDHFEINEALFAYDQPLLGAS